MNICHSKDQDGLGIINLRNFSLALKCKLLWNLLTCNLCLKWPCLVKSRYYAYNNMSALLNMAPIGASPLWQELKRCFPIVNMLSSFSLSDGKNIIFWENKWVGDLALKHTWPYLYSISRKKCSVEKMVLSYSERQLEIFPVSFNSLNAFHSSFELHDFIDKMDSICLSLGTDLVELNLTTHKQFTVKS